MLLLEIIIIILGCAMMVMNIMIVRCEKRTLKYYKKIQSYHMEIMKQHDEIFEMFREENEQNKEIMKQHEAIVEIVDKVNGRLNNAEQRKGEL